MRAIMCEMSLETFNIINQMPKINRAHWNLPWMSCILKFRSLKISLKTLERSFHRGEKTKICREASWDIWNSPLWSDGTKAANWGSRKGYPCECCFLFFFLPSWIPHLSMHLEKSRRWSVLWTIWNFSMISAEKVPGSFYFCHRRGVDFASASSAPRAKAMT